MSRRDVINKELSFIVGLANSENVDDDNKTRGLTALQNLEVMYYELKKENENLRLKYPQEKPCSDTRKTIEDPNHDACEQSKNIKNEDYDFIVNKLNARKVKYILKKFKELHKLMEDYDSSTPKLASRIEGMKTTVAKAFESYQGNIKELCEDGLLEYISTKLVDFCANSKEQKIKDERKALAYHIYKAYAVKRNSMGKSSKANFKVVAMPVQEVKNLHRSSLKKPRNLKKYIKVMTQIHRPESFKKDSNIEHVPSAIIKDLYHHCRVNVADNILERLNEDPVPKTDSCADFVRNLLLSEAESDAPSIASYHQFDWYELLEAQEESYKSMCETATRYEAKLNEPLKSFTSRLCGETFPKLIKQEVLRSKVFGTPVVKKYSFGGTLKKCHSRPSVFYSNQKCFYNSLLKESAKGKSRQRFKTTFVQEGDETSKLGTKSRSDEELKRYISSFQHDRMDKLEASIITGKSSIRQPLSSAFDSLKVSTPPLDSEMVNERLIKVKEKGQELTSKPPSKTRKSSKPR